MEDVELCRRAGSFFLVTQRINHKIDVCRRRMPCNGGNEGTARAFLQGLFNFVSYQLLSKKK